jgi:hypothetical protein
MMKVVRTNLLIDHTQSLLLTLCPWNQKFPMAAMDRRAWVGKEKRSRYPSDVSDEEWEFVAPYLVLCWEDAPQREHRQGRHRIRNASS